MKKVLVLVQRWKWKISNGDIIVVCAQLSFWLLCLSIAHMLGHWEGAPAKASRATIFTWLREGRPLLITKRKNILIVVSLLSFLGTYCSFLIDVLSHRAHTEALRRRPRHSIAHHHLSLAERRAPSPQEEKKKPFWLLFLSCLSLAARVLRHCKGAGAASSCVIVSWCRWLLMFDVLFPCDCAPTQKEERRFFFPGGVHFCWHQLACTSEFACRRVHALATSPPKHLFHAESFFWGGVLLRIMMLAERYVLLKIIAVSTSSCVRGHYSLTVNRYFFVSTILKVPTEFSFSIDMVITKKYWLIPTKKYRLSIQL